MPQAEWRAEAALAHPSGALLDTVPGPPRREDRVRQPDRDHQRGAILHRQLPRRRGREGGLAQGSAGGAGGGACGDGAVGGCLPQPGRLAAGVRAGRAGVLHLQPALRRDQAPAPLPALRRAGLRRVLREACRPAAAQQRRRGVGRGGARVRRLRAAGQHLPPRLLPPLQPAAKQGQQRRADLERAGGAAGAGEAGEAAADARAPAPLPADAAPADGGGARRAGAGAGAGAGCWARGPGRQLGRGAGARPGLPPRQPGRLARPVGAVVRLAVEARRRTLHLRPHELEAALVRPDQRAPRLLRDHGEPQPS